MKLHCLARNVSVLIKEIIGRILRYFGWRMK